ncbi:g5039 [Coccomyxa viridis]|uniref:G5039 protein n=1 Tax=Coccomyxa viridis TaxID=1274662 RepID=A0ABP1FU28_9CHLO
MYMDMQDGPSTSFQYRGRGGRNNTAHRGRGRDDYQGGGRNSGRGRGGYNNYEQRGQYEDDGYDGRYSNGGFGNNRGGAYNNRGRQQQQPQQSRGRSNWGNTGRRGAPRGRGRDPQGGRIQSRYDRPPQQRFEDQPKDVEFVGPALKGHESRITALLYDPTSSQVFTGSKDETVRVWDVATGKCTSVVQVGGHVDSLLMESGYLFVGMHITNTPDKPGLIKVWNMQTGQQHDLPGHQAEVLALATTAGMLFSAGKDQSIRAWQFDAASGTFRPTVTITAAQGGHSGPVQVLLPFGQFLLSADWLGTLKVWDMASGQCVQTMQQAHKEPIMGVLQWESHIITCSLDGTIKVWNAIEPASPGAVLDVNAAYTFPPEEPGKPPEQWGGVLAISGAIDKEQKPLLMASYNDDNCVRLFDLPSFQERGSLPQMRDSRAIAAVPGDILVAGDVHGTVKVWRWKAPRMAVA